MRNILLIDASRLNESSISLNLARHHPGACNWRVSGATYQFGISTILPVTPPFPSNSCACLASARGNRCAMSGLIFCC